MKILISLLAYGQLTGSEMYVYELAKELLKLGHTVGIASLATHMESGLVAQLQHEHLKYYQLGDTPNDWDIVHANQTQVAEMCKLIFKCPIIQSVHSEVLDRYETPVDGMSHYISIRPAITEKLLKKYPKEKVSEIYNGVDRERFHPYPDKKEKIIVFCGTLNNLREKAAKDVAQYLDKGYKIIYVGPNWDRIPKSKNPNAVFLGSIWDTENLLRKAELTAGIMLGRTTIEGYQCGMGAIIYDIDADGNILDKKVTPPLPDEKYYSDNSTKEIEKIYKLYVKG